MSCARSWSLQVDEAAHAEALSGARSWTLPIGDGLAAYETELARRLRRPYARQASTSLRADSRAVLR